MEIEIAPMVKHTRDLYQHEADKSNLTLAGFVKKQYETLLPKPELQQIEERLKRGVKPTTLSVSEWTPDTASLMLAIATVALAVELKVAK
jgi:hypothetical protein